MRPISPATGADEAVVAENQIEYSALPAAFYRYQDGSTGVLTRWTLNALERSAVAAGADVFVMQIGAPIRPMIVQVGPDAIDPTVSGGNFTVPESL